MIRKRSTALAALVAAGAVLLAAGCGSSGSSGPAATGSGSAGATQTVTVGVFADITGPAASGNKTVEAGVKAGTYYAARNGYKIKYVVGDTATNPTTALAVAQKFVTQDHVLAVIASSAITFTASTYLTAHNVPVIGIGEDGPEWITAKNMFSVTGPLQQTKVATTMGKFFKLEGVTSLGSIGYSVSPLSSEAASASAASAEAAGIKVGYLNAKFPFGSTNVGPAVLQMKDAGIDGLVTSTDSDTGFALIKGLRDSGVNLKAALLPTGYGGDLIQAGAGALSSAQNVYFLLGYEPVEMQTTATKQFVADLKSGGTTGEPTYAMYNGYVSIGLLVRALKAAGGTPSQAGLLKGLEGIHDWNALGLYGSHKVDINDRVNVVSGPDNCSWMTKLVGDKFELVKGATPICGDVIPGKTVAAAS
ncbi:ABC transporter substrate-binding protein [Frankia sp. AgB1.9]|uniref:ABC transporter substrate-binding protein n=1 Tax=unclassified Frankia TaxID=2632575 RepID=UPI001932BF52|nr:MULTISPECIES: ABC transporter substrate-binding protein [unclassified Frankia]MBL7489492.1 ABC transporter substrate-binding protein [Frankia sp. AgW1.1]MBL7547778.1 ABC transporter substrate-binding protein [Frankia sp. AgB1.9]MBL7621266.1 ABC transporter substrate-binding protein [Frankia sp. AgB1.8]